MTSDLRRVPTTAGRVRVNAHAGRAGAHVIGLTDATTLQRRIATAACASLVRIGGAGLLPRAGGDWTQVPPSIVESELHALAPGFSMLGVVLPRQPERRHMMVFGRSLGTLVVAKLDGDPQAIDHEAAVLQLLAQRPIPSMLTPTVLAVGSLDLGEVQASAMVTAVVAHRSAPAFAEALPWLDRDLDDRLSSLERAADTPSHWTASHGDLAPWNLRRTPFGLALFDWETTGFAPPGFDRAHYQACNAALGKMPWPEFTPDVARHLRDIIDRRTAGGLGPVDRAMLDHLPRTGDHDTWSIES